MEPYEYRGAEPLNREPEMSELLSSFITSTEPYDRNHGPIPQLKAANHVVNVDGIVLDPLSLTIDQLRHDFDQHEVLCALQCAGNRRHTMRTLIKDVEGIDWLDGAVMNCVWKGPRLGDVIKRARIGTGMYDEENNVYTGNAAFACYEQEVQQDRWYGGSIQLERAMNPGADVILALEMNGVILSAEHGAPVRVIVPGVAGARSVKWLNRITVQRQESMNFYQQHDYKILPPEATDKESADEYWGKVPAMMEMPVNSVIGLPDDGAIVKADSRGMIEVRGYAVPHGGDGPVQRVEVSSDGGETWTDAILDYGGFGDPKSDVSRHKIKWAWCLWCANVKVLPGTGRRIVSRATDLRGNSQEEQSQWNLRGVGYNGWGQTVNLTVT